MLIAVFLVISTAALQRACAARLDLSRRRLATGALATLVAL